ncbi:MAG: hypothetical protein AB7F43_11540 [Bacteriovoracia bacterium]
MQRKQFRMKALLIRGVTFVVLALSFVQASHAEILFPEKIFLTSKTECITRKYFVALRENKIWVKGTEEAPVEDRAWHLFGRDGQPTSTILSVAPRNFNLETVSCDGDNLVVLDGSGQIFYAKFYEPNAWTFRWGWKFLIGDYLYEPQNLVGMAMSHRGKDNEYYESRYGTRHPVSVGVTTLYALVDEGRSLIFADPWLSNGFGHRVSLPLRGRFMPIAIDASASTIFVIGVSGQMFTRLVDFDSVGDDPVLEYTYEPGKREDDGPIGLPGEEWREQHRRGIKGKITDRITILQNGKGNAARELRIEARNENGLFGYYSKPIYSEDDWVFVPTGAESFVGEIIVDNMVEPLAPKRDLSLNGKITEWGLSSPQNARLIGFNLEYDKAVINVQMGSLPIYIWLHTRRLSLNKDGKSGTLRAMIEIPEDLRTSDDFHKRRVAEQGFHNNHWVDAQVWFDENSVQIESEVYLLNDSLRVPWPSWLEMRFER